MRHRLRVLDSFPKDQRPFHGPWGDESRRLVLGYICSSCQDVAFSSNVPLYSAGVVDFRITFSMCSHWISCCQIILQSIRIRKAIRQKASGGFQDGYIGAPNSRCAASMWKGAASLSCCQWWRLCFCYKLLFVWVFLPFHIVFSFSELQCGYPLVLEYPG
jgi:hypothetical protein